MWFFENDKTKPVITAQEHIKSGHKRRDGITLPQTAMLFYLHGAIDFINSHYNTEPVTESFPRFLNVCDIYKFSGSQVCFLDGGRGAPQAVDTLETLAAFGVKRVISVGMCGVFAEDISVGDIIVPKTAYIEEGTSCHYYKNPEISSADETLHQSASRAFSSACQAPIVSTDAVYRQTFYKEELWRKKGCVGVDMETSALFSVSRYLGIQTVALLIASDKHPQSETQEKWHWALTREQRYGFVKACTDFALNLSHNS